MGFMKASVLSLKEKSNTTLVFLLPNCPQVLTIFNDWPIKKYVDDFGTWLLDYKKEFSCLYIPQGLYFINTVWLWSIDKYVVVVVVFEWKSTFYMTTRVIF